MFDLPKTSEIRKPLHKKLIYEKYAAELSGNKKDKFDADAIEMEGAAIAQVCKLDNIPFIVIRGISDSPNGNNAITFEQYLQKASYRCAEIIKKFIN